MQVAVRSHGNLFGSARGEDRIEMRREGDIRTFAILDRMGDDVARAVDARNAADGPELRHHPFGALLFEKRGRRDSAKLQVLLVNPLLFAGKPLQGLADGGLIDKLAQEPGESGWLTWNGRDLSAGSKMPV